MFICGSGSFSQEDEDDFKEAYSKGESPCPTPKRSKKNTSFCPKNKGKSSNKNPYAKRGLDKFYALLADLDSKKQKIYKQKGAEDISLVRFVYTNNSDDRVKPIVVKKNSSNLTTQAHDDKMSTAAAAEVPKKEEQIRRKKRRCLRCKESFMRLQPWFYFPVVVVVLVLMFLAMYGRSFAILCTSIGWYMVPTNIGGRGTSSSSSSPHNERKPKRKKEYARRPSEMKIVHSEGPSSPKSVLFQIK